MAMEEEDAKRSCSGHCYIPLELLVYTAELAVRARELSVANCLARLCKDLSKYVGGVLLGRLKTRYEWLISANLIAFALDRCKFDYYSPWVTSSYPSRDATFNGGKDDESTYGLLDRTYALGWKTPLPMLSEDDELDEFAHGHNEEYELQCVSRPEGWYRKKGVPYAAPDRIDMRAYYLDDKSKCSRPFVCFGTLDWTGEPTTSHRVFRQLLLQRPLLFEGNSWMVGDLGPKSCELEHAVSSTLVRKLDADLLLPLAACTTWSKARAYVKATLTMSVLHRCVYHDGSPELIEAYILRAFDSGRHKCERLGAISKDKDGTVLRPEWILVAFMRCFESPTVTMAELHCYASRIGAKSIVAQLGAICEEDEAEAKALEEAAALTG